MNRALWLLGEIVLGLMLAGALTGVAVPVLMREGRDVGPLVGGLALGIGVVLCVVAGERLRKTRQRDRLP
jgi:hypothetical protein